MKKSIILLILMFFVSRTTETKATTFNCDHCYTQASAAMDGANSRYETAMNDAVHGALGDILGAWLAALSESYTIASWTFSGFGSTYNDAAGYGSAIQDVTDAVAAWERDLDNMLLTLQYCINSCQG